MTHCIKQSEYLANIDMYDLVGGPWENACEDCDSSSSSADGPTPTPTATPAPPTATPAPPTATPAPPTPTPTTAGSNLLFNRQSFTGMLSNTYLDYLNAAADRWSQYIRYKPSLVNSLKSIDPDWDGLELATTVNQSVSISISSPAVFTVQEHNYSAGTPLGFAADPDTPGSTLPTGITQGQTYYVISAGLSPDTFRVSATPGGPAISTSGTQTGGQIVIQPGAIEYSNPLSGTIASCGVWAAANNQSYSIIQSMSFFIYVNTYWTSQGYNQQDWINVMTHELGHALGIGIFWGARSAPTDHFLNGSDYSNSQSTYNSLTSLSRTKIPVEDTGGQGTNSAHWEDNYRSAAYTGSGGQEFRGLSNELMVGYYDQGMNMVLSQMSIKNLVDFGYEEINPGASEGSLTIVSGPGMIGPYQRRLHCSRPAGMVYPDRKKI